MFTTVSIQKALSVFRLRLVIKPFIKKATNVITHLYGMGGMNETPGLTHNGWAGGEGARIEASLLHGLDDDGGRISVGVCFSNVFPC